MPGREQAGFMNETTCLRGAFGSLKTIMRVERRKLSRHVDRAETSSDEDIGVREVAAKSRRASSVSFARISARHWKKNAKLGKAWSQRRSLWAPLKWTVRVSHCFDKKEKCCLDAFKQFSLLQNAILHFLSKRNNNRDSKGKKKCFEHFLLAELVVSREPFLLGWIASEACFACLALPSSNQEEAAGRKRVPLNAEKIQRGLSFLALMSEEVLASFLFIFSSCCGFLVHTHDV